MKQSCVYRPVHTACFQLHVTLWIWGNCVYFKYWINNYALAEKIQVCTLLYEERFEYGPPYE